MTRNKFPHCAVVGRSAPYKKNACYFYPKKMTDRRGGGCKLMDKKGVACKDNDCRWGTSKTLVHRNSINKNISYEDSLRCSPTPSYIDTLPTNTKATRKFLLQRDTDIVDSGATHLYIDPTAPRGPRNTSAPKISVGTATVYVDRLSETATLPIP